MNAQDRLNAIEARHSAWYSGDDTTAEWADPIDFVVGYELDKDSTPRKRAMAHEITREDIPYLLDLARKQQAALKAVLAIHREIECQDEDGEPTGGTACEECKDLDDHSGERVHEAYPCLTVRDITKALAGEQTFAGMRDSIEASVEAKP